jgi:hypothetical protein
VAEAPRNVNIPIGEVHKIKTVEDAKKVIESLVLEIYRMYRYLGKDVHEHHHTTNITNVTDVDIVEVIELMIEAQDYSVFYAYDNNIAILEPGEYGQVLTTSGDNASPFWAWVWQEPGGEGAPSVYHFVVITSSYAVAQLVPDAAIAPSAAALTADPLMDQGGPNTDWDYSWNYPEISATDAHAIETADQTLTNDTIGQNDGNASFQYPGSDNDQVDMQVDVDTDVATP